VQRLWRLVGEIAALAAPAGAGVPPQFGEEALAVRRAAHKALAAVGGDIERLGFNRCVAHIYTLANALQREVEAHKGAGSGAAPAADLAFAFREAGEILVRLVAPMMPHLSEECWQALGGAGLVAEGAWPEADPALLVEDTITLPVQVNGRKRADLVIARDADQAAVEAAALALDAVQRATEGRPVRKVIVVPQRIVNVVA
jgi:leucyl-tRNA synthetase